MDVETSISYADVNASKAYITLTEFPRLKCPTQGSFLASDTTERITCMVQLECFKRTVCIKHCRHNLSYICLNIWICPILLITAVMRARPRNK